MEEFLEGVHVAFSPEGLIRATLAGIRLNPGLRSKLTPPDDLKITPMIREDADPSTLGYQKQVEMCVIEESRKCLRNRGFPEEFVAPMFGYTSETTPADIVERCRVLFAEDGSDSVLDGTPKKGLEKVWVSPRGSPKEWAGAADISMEMLRACNAENTKACSAVLMITECAVGNCKLPVGKVLLNGDGAKLNSVIAWLFGSDDWVDWPTVKLWSPSVEVIAGENLNGESINGENLDGENLAGESS